MQKYVALSVLAALGVSGVVALRRATPPASLVAATAAPSAPVQTLREARHFRAPELTNRAAYIPAQCYAQTRESDAIDAKTHNGCFVCHQASQPPNYVNDEDVQTELSFASYAAQNRWNNLSTPPAPASIDDDALLSWVRTSNYFEADRSLTLALALNGVTDAWDANHDGKWNGYVPDCFFNIDEEGFDASFDGKKTGWRAYAWLPTPGMFMPTNGSLGDALIRLPEAYRKDAAGHEDDAIYRINLAIVEAYVKRGPVPISATDESSFGSDLDGDGKLGVARRIGFVWPPREGRPFHYVGLAATLDPKKDGWPVAGLFPRGTEFLHSVRYLDVVDGKVTLAARMKELRYMRKLRWLDYGQLDQGAQAEAREKFKSPDKLKQILADAERGVTTGVGWLMQGFIENEGGRLRPQNVEETTACIGCHGGVGASTDATFSFARKLGAGAFQDGWFHTSQHDLSGVPEPKRADGAGEYSHYLRQVGGADDFRSNDEARRKFFRDDGSLNPSMTRELARDVSVLLMPSADRALALDRAYLGLVKAQRFEAGRDVALGAPPQLALPIVQDAPTGIATPVLPAWKRAAPVTNQGS